MSGLPQIEGRKNQSVRFITNASAIYGGVYICWIGLCASVLWR